MLRTYYWLGTVKTALNVFTSFFSDDFFILSLFRKAKKAA